MGTRDLLYNSPVSRGLALRPRSTHPEGPPPDLLTSYQVPPLKGPAVSTSHPGDQASTRELWGTLKPFQTLLLRGVLVQLSPPEHVLEGGVTQTLGHTGMWRKQDSNPGLGDTVQGSPSISIEESSLGSGRSRERATTPRGPCLGALCVGCHGGRGARHRALRLGPRQRPGLLQSLQEVK